MHSDAVAKHAAQITAALLSVFSSVAGDIPNTEGIQSLLAVMARAPHALPAMAREGVPLLMAQLQDAAQHAGPRRVCLVEGTLDLLASFISASNIGAFLHFCLIICSQAVSRCETCRLPCAWAEQACALDCPAGVQSAASLKTSLEQCAQTKCTCADVTREIYGAIAQPVFHLCLHSGEANVAQSCCEIFRKFLQAGGATMLTWGGSSEDATMQMLLQVFESVLKPGAEDSAAMMVAGLALQARLALDGTAQGRALAPQLLQLLVSKTLACSMQALRGQLLVVITRCARSPDSRTMHRRRCFMLPSLVFR